MFLAGSCKSLCKDTVYPINTGMDIGYKYPAIIPMYVFPNNINTNMFPFLYSLCFIDKYTPEHVPINVVMGKMNDKYLL
jgi:hypothetical protein